MNETELLATLTQAHPAMPEQMQSWYQAVPLLAALDSVAQQGGCVVVKIDGDRSTSMKYTVVLSGGSMGDDCYRRDGAHLHTLLLDAIRFYLHRTQAP